MATANFGNSDTRVVLRYDIRPRRDRFRSEDGSFFRPRDPNRAEAELQLRIGDSKEPLADNFTRVNGPAGQRNVINFSDSIVNPFSRSFGSIPVVNQFLAPAIDVDLGKQTLKFKSQTISTGFNTDEREPFTPLEFEGRNLFIKNFAVVIGSLQDDRIVGDKNNNVLNGKAGADILIGKGGNDVLVADRGDTLTGGQGKDRFRLTAASLTRSSGRAIIPVQSLDNTITDFESGEDRIQLARKNQGIPTGFLSSLNFRGFSSLEKGRISAEQFNLIESEMVLGAADDGFYYNTNTGDLLYKGGEVASPLPYSKIATLEGAPTLTARDIVVI